MDPPDHVKRRQQSGETRHFTSMFLTCAQLKEAGGFDESLRFGDEVDLVKRLVETGSDLIVLDEIVVDRRIFSDSLTFEPEVDRSLFGLLRRRVARQRS
ncbi:MAG: hypothetical protein AAFY28_22365 [Actinomycetota bacterium]